MARDNVRGRLSAIQSDLDSSSPDTRRGSAQQSRPTTFKAASDAGSGQSLYCAATSLDTLGGEWARLPGDSSHCKNWVPTQFRNPPFTLMTSRVILAVRAQKMRRRLPRPPGEGAQGPALFARLTLEDPRDTSASKIGVSRS